VICLQPHCVGSQHLQSLLPLLVLTLLLLALQAEPVILLDPNTLSEDGTVALKDAVFR
jgi:hypothetical protein